MGRLTSATLFVEGPDDEHVVGQLLLRRGFAAPDIPAIEPIDGIDKMLSSIVPVVVMGTGQSAGFLLDANDDPQARWQAVKSRLGSVDVAAPEQIPEDGFVGVSTEYKTRVGVWLMPDNRRGGAVEEFLRDLIPSGDPLVDLAEASTARARDLGARFREAHASKAVLHAWLAWQRTPGLPYGAAIKAGFFAGGTTAPDRFVEWCVRLFPSLALDSTSP